MKTIYKSIALEAALLSVTLALQAEIQSDGETVTADVQANTLDRLKVTLVSPNVSGARDLVASGNATIGGNEIAVNLENLAFGTHRLVVSARFGTQIRTLYALDISVPRAELPNETQEYEDAAIVVSTYGDGGGEFPTDYAKQGEDPTATLTDTQAYAQAAAEDAAAAKNAAQSLTSLDSDINAGKTAIAQAVTAKGVPGITPQDTLVEMANGVMQIAQQPIEIDGGDMYAAQLTGDGTLWDLYQVLVQMKNRFINASYEHGGQTYNFAALIVCEYYKGYDSLQLQGADCYFTCDGDFYDYASPNHVWHDSDNGKMNRWVAFLYTQDGARLDITNTAISPRSMYIGGHIGTIEYFVNGRLTELVCGVEETDVLDNLLFKEYPQDWSKAVNIKAKNIPKNQLIIEYTVFNNIEVDNAYTLTVSDYAVKSKAQYVHLKLNNGATVSDTALFDCDALNRSANLVGIVIDGNVELFYGGKIVQTHRFEGGGNSYAPNLAFIHTQGLTKMNNNAELFRSSSSPNLNDVIVGEMTTNLQIRYWNPTTVLEDADKKATLIDNIKNHILARVSDATGGTQLVFTVSTNMYNAIALENITWQDQTMTLADAFLMKNWLLAGA